MMSDLNSGPNDGSYKDRSYNPGDRISIIAQPPLTRTTLALYCGASHDHNPIHVDSDVAKQKGLPDVIGHGMLSMAFMAQCLTSLFPPEAIKSYGTRFVGMARIGDAISCYADVEKITEFADGRLLHLTMAAEDQSGDKKLVGSAIVLI